MGKIHFFRTLIFLCFTSFSTYELSAQGITNISPSQGDAGATVSVTITFDSNATPPLPPSNVEPSAVSIGSLAATSYSRVSETTVTAEVAIPAAMVSGNYDVSVTLGPTTYTLSEGFQINGSSTPTVCHVDGDAGSDSNDGSTWTKAKR